MNPELTHPMALLGFLTACLAHFVQVHDNPIRSDESKEEFLREIAERIARLE